MVVVAATQKLKLLLAAVAALTAVLAPSAAMAADNSGALNLETSPLPINLVAKPGTSVSTDLRIKNNGGSPEQLKVSILKFGAAGEDGSPQLMDPAPSDDFVKWVKLSPAVFTAEPNVWNTVHMTINVPKSAAFGYYYAIMFSRANEATATNQANLHGAIATLVLLEAQVPGAKRQAEVTEFSSKHSLYEFLPAEFRVRLRNSGNVHVAPRGNIFITKGGKNIATLEVNLNQGNILPSSYRLFTASWKDGYPVYKLEEEDGKVALDKHDHQISGLNWAGFEPSKIRFGRYTAHLVLAYDNGTRDVPIEAQLTFWVVPWRLIFGILALVSLLIGLGYFFGRWQARRARKKYS